MYVLILRISCHFYSYLLKLHNNAYKKHSYISLYTYTNIHQHSSSNETKLSNFLFEKFTQYKNAFFKLIERKGMYVYVKKMFFLKAIHASQKSFRRLKISQLSFSVT